MRNSTINHLTEYAAADDNIFVIAGDGGYGVLDKYQQEMPKQYLNMGVAEQNAIGFAAGLAMTGRKVFVYNITPFVLYRCYEQVRNDICYQKVPVVLIGIGSGLAYAPGGMTHYSVEDIALARTMPGLEIISPADPVEACASVDYVMRSDKPAFIRIARGGEPKIHNERIEDISKPILMNKGSRTAVLFHGAVSVEVMEMLKMAVEKPTVISIPMVSPLDFDCLEDMLEGVDRIVTVEEHYVVGGLGSIVGEWILDNDKPYKLKKLGVDYEFIHQVKNNKGMRELFGISSDKILKSIYGK